LTQPVRGDKTQLNRNGPPPEKQQVGNRHVSAWQSSSATRNSLTGIASGATLRRGSKFSGGV